jgi:hypothetical protein
MIDPQAEDVANFILDFCGNPRNDSYSTYGYEIYLPGVIVAYILEIENSTEHRAQLYNGPRALVLSPIFYDAAWTLCRLGVLRPGIRRLDLQATADGASGNGYSLTVAGKRWIAEGLPVPLLTDAGRLSQLFHKLGKNFGADFSQRASEAARCHSSGTYLASCAMCGAAAEAILLSVAIAKIGDEDAVLAEYKTASGRTRVVKRIVGTLRESLASQFRSATGLLNYWRDEAAHGATSTISEIEAHEAPVSSDSHNSRRTIGWSLPLNIAR